ncbi:hypothetical protein [Streptomyces sp. NK15101]|uniref:hypothetical protein n=1 Tax=Streptomyces sp. NK15101 TaxID=2873261 RepID=UPI001CECD650|nr:hypothetical protein [Streptomyces sp. NK15101]
MAATGPAASGVAAADTLPRPAPGGAPAVTIGRAFTAPRRPRPDFVPASSPYG